MSNHSQMDLFKHEPTQVESLQMEVASLKASLDKQRKSFFARQTEIMNLYLEMMQKIEALEERKSSSKIVEMEQAF